MRRQARLKAVQPGVDEAGEFEVELDPESFTFALDCHDVAEDEVRNEVAVAVKNGEDGSGLLKKIQNQGRVAQSA